MSNIKKLLEGVEVEWKTLGEIAENVSSGGTPNTGVEAFYGGNIPWLRTQEVGNGDIWSTSIKITELGLKNSSAKIIPANCIIVAMYGATVGKVGVNKIPLCTNQACANVQINAKIANYRYVYHFLLSQYKYIKSLGAGSQTNINLKIVKSLLIPIPCPNNLKKSLEIQQEIVRILDSFSMLTAELQTKLQAELQARKSQYEYYRNQLLAYPMEESDQSSLRSNRSATSIQNSDTLMQPLSTLNPHTGNSVLQPRGKVEWKMLGEIGTFIRGKGLQKKDFMENGVPCIHYGQIYTHYGTFATKTKSFISKETANKCKKAHKGDLIIASTSENVEDVGKTVAWLGDDDVAISNHTFIYSHNQNPKYLAYLFQTQAFLKYKKTKVVGVKVIDIPQKALESFCIPVPPLEEQERIVSILDKFDALTTSLTEGLPKEIELRQKQYEYYRNMLLSFPKNNIKA